MPGRDTCPPGTPRGGVQAPCGCCQADADSRPGRGDPEPGWLAHLYTCRGLSTYRIAGLTGLDRQRVTRMLHRAGVPLRPRGAGRQRPVRRRGDPPDIGQLMRVLYEEGMLSSRQVAAVLDMPERTVRERLRRYGIAVRTRGGWNREDRLTIPAGILRELYSQLGLTADQVGQRLGKSRSVVLRSAHTLGVPVRTGGAVPVSGPEEIELVSALYDDRQIVAVLDAQEIGQVPAGAPLWERFPVPVPLTATLVKELYWGCGAGTDHIELLTGQPAMTVRGFMHRAGIPLRQPGGRSPFLRRWRAASALRTSDTSTSRPADG